MPAARGTGCLLRSGQHFGEDQRPAATGLILVGKSVRGQLSKSLLLLLLLFFCFPGLTWPQLLGSLPLPLLPESHLPGGAAYGGGGGAKRREGDEITADQVSK